MAITKSGLLKEAIRRTEASQAPVREIELDPNFPQQNNFITDPSRFISAQCSRRAGKTNGLALRFFKTMERHPKSQCIYMALTRESAKDIMWTTLQDLNDVYGVGCTFKESTLEMKHPNGATLKLYGADMKNFIKRLKGRKYPGIAIDEAQDFDAHLEVLVNDVLTPSMVDYADGWIALTGTPGPVPTGYFFNITYDGKYGYSRHGWTILDNPHIPNAKEFIEELKAKHEWNDDHPTLLREWRNKWVLDTNSLWIRYDEKVNHFTDLPKEHKFNYIMGVDIGFNDADAIAVLAWSDTHPAAYLVEEKIERKQGLTELLEQIQQLEKKYEITKIVMDEGGLGKKLAEELRRRYGVPIQPADKLRKQENVELLNDQMRVGRFKAKKDSQFALDSYKVQIDWDKSTPSRIVVKKKPHSDIIDAVLYAFKETYAFAAQPIEKKPVYGSKEWAEAQEDSMWEAELNGHMQAEQWKKEQFEP